MSLDLRPIRRFFSSHGLAWCAGYLVAVTIGLALSTTAREHRAARGPAFHVDAFVARRNHRLLWQ